MRTEEAIKQIKPYLIGDLTPKETAALEGHLDVDEEARWWHARYYRQLLPVLKQPEAEPSPGVTEALFARARVMIEEGKEVQRPFLKVMAGELWTYRNVAAALVVAAGLTFAMIGFGSGKPKPETLGTVAVAPTETTPGRSFQHRAGDVVKVPAGTVATLRLAGGTIVRMSGGTELVTRAPAKGEFLEGEDVGLVLDVRHGDVMVDSTDAGREVPDLAVVSPSGTFQAAARGGALFAVSYRGPVAVVERRTDRVIDLDMQRQSVADVLDVARTHFSRPVAYPHTAGEWFVDVRGRGLDWDGYVAALADANIKIQEADGGWKLVDSNNGHVGLKAKREIFDVTLMSGICVVSSEGVGRVPFAVPVAIGETQRLAAYVPVDGTPVLSAASVGEKLDRDMVRLFLRGQAPSEGAKTSFALVTVLDRSVSGTTVGKYNYIPTKDGTMLQVMGDGNKLIQVGSWITIEGRTGRVIFLDQDRKAFYIEDAAGDIHKFEFGE
jgi:hypothetical protein